LMTASLILHWFFKPVMSSMKSSQRSDFCICQVSGNPLGHQFGMGMES
jgi:hypothetical protein